MSSRCGTRSGWPRAWDTLTAISRAAPPSPRRLDPGLPQDLERIALHALERAPSARYPRLRRAGGRPARLPAAPRHLAAGAHPLQAARLWLRRNRRGASVAAAAAGVLAVAWLASGVVRLRLDRAEFAADMSSLSDRLPSLTQPDEVQSAYMELKAIKDRAGPLESRLFAPLFGSLRPQVAALSRRVQPAPRRARLQVAQARHGADAGAHGAAALVAGADARPAHLPGQRRQPPQSRSRPGRPAGAGSRGGRRGARRAPPAGRGSRRHPAARAVEPDGGPSGARPLSSGTYRILVRRGGGRPCEETDQIVRVEEPRRQIATRSPPATDGGNLRPLPRRRRGPPRDARSPRATSRLAAQHIEAPPCLLGVSLVTWAEFEAVLPEARHSFEARRPENVPPEAPAVVPWRLASEYAQAIGARLPSALELHLGWNAPGVALPRTRGGHHRRVDLQRLVRLRGDE
jgi:hypothetical protein